MQSDMLRVRILCVFDPDVAAAFPNDETEKEFVLTLVTDVHQQTGLGRLSH